MCESKFETYTLPAGHFEIGRREPQRQPLNDLVRIGVDRLENARLGVGLGDAREVQETRARIVREETLGDLPCDLVLERDPLADVEQTNGILEHTDELFLLSPVVLRHVRDTASSRTMRWACRGIRRS